ncbi:MAG TPA: hypothetical protein VGW75_10190 [Solirubrobacteraceae bacterium]|jgi:hypothetical protein|nr:hypothetical protein [Solirubrobacteraceae bacterium]
MPRARTAATRAALAAAGAAVARAALRAARVAVARAAPGAAVALAAAALLPATAAAAPPPNDAFSAPAQFEGYSTRNGFPIERQAVAELAEATPDAVPRCLGDSSMARTVWFAVPAGPNARELTFEAVGRTTDPLDLAAFVQDPAPGPPTRPNACAGAGAGGDDATEDRTTALRLRVPAFHPVLLQVGRRGLAGAPDDERAHVTVEDIPLPPLGAPAGDRATPTTPRIGRSGQSTVALGGATTTPEDPAVPSCPTVAGVWRRIVAPKPGAWTVTAVGDHASALTVFAGSAPRASALAGCVDRDGPGPLVLPFARRTRATLWVRVGTDRPGPESEALVTFRPRLASDVESGGGCLASERPRVSGGPARASRRVRDYRRTRAFELSLRAARGPVCNAAIELVGPRRVVYARGGAPALRGSAERVVLRRIRPLRRGLYRLRIEANGLGGVRRRVPSTVLFRLK